MRILALTLSPRARSMPHGQSLQDPVYLPGSLCEYKQTWVYFYLSPVLYKKQHATNTVLNLSFPLNVFWRQFHINKDHPYSLFSDMIILCMDIPQLISHWWMLSFFSFFCYCMQYCSNDLVSVILYMCWYMDFRFLEAGSGANAFR